MRKLVCLLSLVLCMAFSSQAQIMTLDNQTACDLKIWVVCVDLNCNVVNETPYDVNAGTTLNVPRCNPPLQTYFLVQYNDPTCPWSSGLLDILTPGNPSNCPTVFGSRNILPPPPFSNFPFPCPCAPGGIINIQYTGGVLSIF